MVVITMIYSALFLREAIRLVLRLPSARFAESIVLRIQSCASSLLRFTTISLPGMLNNKPQMKVFTPSDFATDREYSARSILDSNLSSASDFSSIKVLSAVLALKFVESIVICMGNENREWWKKWDCYLGVSSKLLKDCVWGGCFLLRVLPDSFLAE